MWCGSGGRGGRSGSGRRVGGGPCAGGWAEQPHKAADEKRGKACAGARGGLVSRAEGRREGRIRADEEEDGGGREERSGAT